MCGVVRQAEMAWWFLFDCLKDSLKTMARHASSPSKAYRVLKDHFLPLTQSQIGVQEEKLKPLRMRSNENPGTFFASMREKLGVPQKCMYCSTALRLYCCTWWVSWLGVDGTAVDYTVLILLNCSMLRYLYCCMYCCCPVDL